MNENFVTPEQQEFQDWLLHPVTKIFLQWARNRREVLKEEWAMAAFTGRETNESLARNYAAQGAVSVYKEVSEVSYEDIYEDSE